MSPMEKITILFVDDEPELLNSINRLLRKEPYQKLFVSSGEEALQMLRKVKVDIIVSDLRMPFMDGLTLLSNVKRKYPNIIRLILSANQDISIALDAINRGEVYRFFSKPMEPDLFKKFIQDVAEYYLLLHIKDSIFSEIEKFLLAATPPARFPAADISLQMTSAGKLAGDFADFYYYNPSQLDFLIGDVMGKGVRSALIAAAVKNAFTRALLFNKPNGLEARNTPRNIQQTALKVMRYVHNYTIKGLTSLDYLVTLCFASFDFNQQEVNLINCGHLPVVHFKSKDRSHALIRSNNFAIGMVDELHYETETVKFNAGDVFLFYSDGITEARAADNQMYGLNRLCGRLKEISDHSADEITDILKNDVLHFTGRFNFDDDMTCVAFKING